MSGLRFVGCGQNILFTLSIPSVFFKIHGQVQANVNNFYDEMLTAIILFAHLTKCVIFHYEMVIGHSSHRFPKTRVMCQLLDVLIQLRD